MPHSAHGGCNDCVMQVPPEPQRLLSVCVLDKTSNGMPMLQSWSPTAELLVPGWKGVAYPVCQQCVVA